MKNIGREKELPAACHTGLDPVSRTCKRIDSGLRTAGMTDLIYYIYLRVEVWGPSMDLKIGMT
ncbi:MAG: hypothetical protein ABFR82_00560 [Nitrospirota bacterium]